MKTGKPVLAGSLGKKEVKQVVHFLNSKQHPDLESLVARYLESGPNLKKMLRADPILWTKLRAVAQTAYVPGTSGRAHLALAPFPMDEPSEEQKDAGFWERDPTDPCGWRTTAKFEDYHLFATVTLNPDWEYLGSPCARCGEYYLKTRISQKVYCSRRCGNQATAIARSKELWATAHKKKVDAARRALKDWNPESGVDWREFVSQSTGFTVKFLTRNRAVVREWIPAKTRSKRARKGGN